MCGICGKVFADAGRRVDRGLLEAMTRTLAHRGPDGDGSYLSGPCGLGHRRLSIIDLPTGAQPISNEDGACWIVFNGEIYNFRELREGLLARGHVFKTRSDTETILHLYEEKRERCVEDLRGMFAFAIWNEREQELFIARDRIGKKPLFYAETDGGIVFASELKALLADPSVSREVDPIAVDQFLTLQYIPAPATIFRGIQKLPPAHWLRWRDGKVDTQCYWTLDYEPKTKIDETEACERLIAHLDEAVRLRLESDVPLGCLLSGGIDSSAVVAMMRRHIAGPLKTFSIGFEEAAFNELPQARLISQQFATEHEEWIVRPGAIEVLPRIVWHCDEPFADPSALPTWHVAESARRAVAVTLTGDGGDESFAGYERYRGIAAIENYKNIPRAVRSSLLGPIGRAAGGAFPRSIALERANDLNALSLLPPERQYARYLTIFRESQKDELYGERLREAAGRESWLDLTRPYSRADLRCAIDRKMFADIATYLPGDLLIKMDRMSMAHGLEARSPFLDHCLMEFAAQLPGEMKFPGGRLKALLKKALAPILPGEILNRPKQGFAVPLQSWFRHDLKTMMRDLLLSDDAAAAGFFRPEAVKSMIDDHVSGRRNHQHRLWTLLVFEIWRRTYLASPGPLAGPIRL